MHIVWYPDGFFMHRRRYVAAAGVTLVGSLAGCLSVFEADDDETDDDTSNDDTRNDDTRNDEPDDDENGGGNGESGDDADGYGTESDTQLDERDIDTDSYERYEVDGVEVPLVPIEDAYYWYQRQEARMVDSRGANQYDSLRVDGAVLSPAPDGGTDDPVADWPKTERIVTYCVCPHALSSARAASLIADGYEEVYALDEGFQEWQDREYPVDGANADMDLTAYEIEGLSDPAYAGETVTVRGPDSEVTELSRVTDDGSYSMTLHLVDADQNTVFEVEAPDYTHRAPLTDLTNDVITS